MRQIIDNEMVSCEINISSQTSDQYFLFLISLFVFEEMLEIKK